MKIYAKDIAKSLGISTATVSLVLNNKPGVSAKKRETIIEKIREMGGDDLLKNLPVDRGTIGLVIYQTVRKVIGESPFFSFLLEHMNRVLQDNGYTLTFIHMGAQLSADDQVELLEKSKCAGYLVYAVEMRTQDLTAFSKVARPCVFIDNPFFGEEIDSVYINSRPGIHEAMLHLYKLGHRKIGYIRSRIELSCFQERFEAYKKELSLLGLPFDKSYVASVSYQEIDSKRDMTDYLSQTRDIPTAFFADNDLIACDSMKGIKEAGYRIPEDISVIGFDNRPICEYSEPQLSSIAMSKNLMGQMAAELLLKKVELKQNHAFHARISIVSEYIDRESDGAADLKH